MTAAAVEPEPVPLARDSVGRLVVMGTRVPLETLVLAFQRGDSPEGIHESYPSVTLGDIYAIFTYCVRHRDAVQDYMSERETQLDALRDEVESGFPTDGLRARLLARLDS